MRHPWFDLPTPLVIGHRGCAGEAPENTLPSFDLGLARGAVVLESDVHLTRDGVPVLLHDAVVDRVTDGRGRVADLDWKQVAALDAGHHFSPDGGSTHPWRGRGVGIASLESAFGACPGARFNLELKEDVPGLVEETLAVVARAKRADLTLLTSGDKEIMQRLHEQQARCDARAAVGASAADVLAFVRAALDRRTPDPRPMALQIPVDFGGRPLVTPELIAHAHAHDVQVHVWTINEPAEMHRLLDLGVDGLVTDFPGRLAELLADRADRA